MKFNFRKMFFISKNELKRIKSFLPNRIRKVDGRDYIDYYKNSANVNFDNKKNQILNKVFLHIPTGTLFDDNLGLLSVSKIGKSQIKRSGLIGTKKPNYKKVRKIEHGSTFYCNSAKGGFYHWLIECIPRYYLIDIGIKCYLPKLSKLNREILDTIYSNTKNIVEVQDDWIFFDIFFLPRYFATPGRGIVFKEFHKHVLSILPKTQKQIVLLYISRAKAPKRKILNETKLIKDVLNKFSVTKVFLEDYSFLEQLEIVNKSKIIIAPHGAGLSNLIAASNSCKILEILSTNEKPMNFYKDLSFSIDLDYTPMLIENPVGRYNDFKLSSNDLNKIKKFIKQNMINDI